MEIFENLLNSVVIKQKIKFELLSYTNLAMPAAASQTEQKISPPMRVLEGMLYYHVFMVVMLLILWKVLIQRTPLITTDDAFAAIVFSSLFHVIMWAVIIFGISWLSE